MKRVLTPAMAVLAVATLSLAAELSLAEELASGIIIRGIGDTRTCSAKTVVPDNDRWDGLAHNLSVNCTDDTSNIDNYAHFTGGLPHSKYCVARIEAVKRLAGSASVKTDRLPNNALHCLVNNVKPKDLVGVMTPKP